MKVLLIGGHGAGDPGATSKINGKSYREDEQARRVCKALYSKISKYLTVNMYPESNSAYRDLKNGNLLVDFSKYDYVLEVHFNAFAFSSADGKVKGVECYSPTSEKDVSVETKICSNIQSCGFTNRGSKKYDWYVIKTAKKKGAKAALLEVCFIDDEDDMLLYEKKFDNIIDAIANGIIDGFGIERDENVTKAEAKQILKDKAGLNDATIVYLDSYKYADELIIKLAEAIER